jgi:hypothetical protein
MGPLSEGRRLMQSGSRNFYQLVVKIKRSTPPPFVRFGPALARRLRERIRAV